MQQINYFKSNFNNSAVNLLQKYMNFCYEKTAQYVVIKNLNDG